MTARTRLWVLLVSTPLIVLAVIGGYLGQAQGRDDTYQHLRIFDDVVSHVVNNYVEEVDLAEAWRRHFCTGRRRCSSTSRWWASIHAARSSSRACSGR
jgi:hypothetical protein